VTHEMSEENNSRNSSLPEECSAASSLPDLSGIRGLDDETWLDYRRLWINSQNRAIHLGYWEKHPRSHAQSLLAMNRVLASHLGIRSGQRILDAGCGVGGSAIWLAKTYDVEVLGITPVASQVARAQRYAQEQGVADQASFEQQDYTHTVFPDATFDVLLSMENLCHAPDKRLVLAEARRLLRPGGRVGLLEYIPPPPPPPS